MLSAESISFLGENIVNADEHISAADGDYLMEAVSEIIDAKGFAPPDYLYYNELGVKAQRVYEELYLTE